MNPVQSNSPDMSDSLSRIRQKRRSRSKRGGGLTIRSLILATVAFAILFSILKLFQNHLSALLILSFFFGISMIIGLSFTLARRKSGFQDAFLELIAISRRTSLPLEVGLRAFAPQCGRSYGRRLMMLANRLEAGVPLSDAVAITSGVMPLDQRVAFRVAEFAGSTTHSMERIVRVRQNRMEALRPIVDMSVYFLFVTMQIISVGGFLSYFISPRMQAIFNDFGMPLPKTFIAIQSIYSNSMISFFLSNFGILAIIAIIYIPALFHSGRGMGFLGRFVPWITTGERASVLRGLADTIQAELPIDDCMLIFADWSMRGQLRRRAFRARRAMLQGVDWTQALHSEGLVKSSEVPLLKSSAESARACWALEQLADSIESRLWYRYRLLAELFSPLFTLFLASLVFLVGLAFFTPLVDLIRRLAS
ncbi:MAG: type II secretion system F family protein [Planctomycetota bacterium]